jgi:hypothetical protein
VLLKTDPFGVLLPHPLWSIKVTKHLFLSKKTFDESENPLPGPPCKKTTGIPFGFPYVSKNTV